MNYSYPILNKVFAAFLSKQPNLDSLHLIACQHLLEPQLEMFKQLISFGFKPQNILVIGKAYSANKEIVEELKALGIKASVPEFVPKSFDIQHAENCLNMLNTLPAGIKDIVILDDGAELVKIFSENQREVLFAVEQTSSGFRKLENLKLNFPVINVARSSIKLEQESPFIARLCFKRIEAYINDSKLQKPTVLVVGLGPIGEAILEIFKDEGLQVEGFDIKHGHSNLVGHIREIKPDIVVGATGFNIITEKDLDTLTPDHQFHFISVSSSDREFPVASFRKTNKIHEDIRYKNFVFVNNGFPITFKGNRYEGTPEEIEKTICLLGGSIVYGILYHSSLTSGLVDVPKELLDIIK